MDTWKNNNVLTRIKESYFLEDTGRGRVPELPSDAKLVGGAIFYIDDTVGGAYEFFDVNGNPVENVQVGGRPYAYRVVSAGSRDKYYVYHDEWFRGVWTYCKDGVYVQESLGTSGSIGSGKTNTETVMSKDGGAYIAEDSNGYPTIWYQLQQTRLAKVGGCDDWFVPSADEAEKLRLAIKSGSIMGGAIAGSSYNTSVFAGKSLWSSSEYSPQYVRLWVYFSQYWDIDDKDANFPVFFVRAF